MATLFNAVFRSTRSFRPTNNVKGSNVRHATTSSSGAILPEPEKTQFGVFGLLFAIVPGLLLGATISKKMANFLEENELFVPSDDDDDDD